MVSELVVLVALNLWQHRVSRREPGMEEACSLVAAGKQSTRQEGTRVSISPSRNIPVT
jgi:hypothetical protein